MHRLMMEAINDSNNDISSSSSSFDTHSTNDDERYIKQQKNRRVRSLIKSSIENFTKNDPIEHDNTENSKQNSTLASSDKRPFPFGQCRVCMDKATGAHYGVPTCEGCKGFFKRSILRKEKYRCYFGGGCVIKTDNRNRCKSCRFEKCLQEGMSVDGVRMGRIPKLVKEKALAENRLSSSSLENDDSNVSSPCAPSINSISNDFEFHLIDEHLFLENLDSASFDSPSKTLPSCTSYILPDNFTIDETEQEDEQNTVIPEHFNSTKCNDYFSKHVIDRIRKLVTRISHQTTYVELDSEESSFIRYLRWKMFELCNTYNGRTRQLSERMNSMMNLEIHDFPGDRSSLQDVWAGLTDAIPFHVKNLIAFAHEMPAINEIESEDFHKIMNNRLFDFWLIKHAPLLRNNESYMMLPNGLQYTRQWMNKIMGEEVVQTMFEFANKFNALHLTQEEYALIFPIFICVKDESLFDQKTVRYIQYCYLYTLYTQMLTTRTQSEAKNVFCNLVQIFSYLPLLNELQERKVDSVILESMESEL